MEIQVDIVTMGSPIAPEEFGIYKIYNRAANGKMATVTIGYIEKPPKEIVGIRPHMIERCSFRELKNKGRKDFAKTGWYAFLEDKLPNDKNELVFNVYAKKMPEGYIDIDKILNIVAEQKDTHSFPGQKVNNYKKTA